MCAHRGCAVLQEAELHERETEQKLEEFKRQIIEEERQKLLRAHAEKLIGYLPRVSGVQGTYPG